MMPDEDQDALLELIARSVLEASDDEIIRVAIDRGVDVAALQDKVRRMVRAASSAADPGRSLAVGDMVVLRSDPDRRGVITAVTASNREPRFSVFIDGRIETLYASQLLIADSAAAPVAAGLDEFQAALTALQLTAPSLENLYSLQAGRIDFIPYQFRPVLKFIRADRPRLLLADEVGVGKTIEAGLLLRELQARRPLRSILIVCSKALVVEQKWQNEMRRFDEEFHALDSRELRYCIDQTDLEGEWPDRFNRAIVPFSLFNETTLLGASSRSGKASPGLLTLEAPPRFDLLIVDEAHNARNPDTHLHQGLRLLADNAEAVVLITATPVQLGAQDLYSLLNLLRPDLVIDRPTFEQMAEPNPAINEAVALIRAGAKDWQADAIACLDLAASTDWGRSILAGSPEFRSVREDIAQATTEEARVRLVHRAEGLHTFAAMINRTRRRDIGEFTSRRPQTVETAFTEAQAELHSALLAAQARLLARAHGDAPLGFLMSTIRRQASSCLHGLQPFLEDILTRRLPELELGLGATDGAGIAETLMDPLRREVASVIALAARLPAEDPKLERLAGIAAEKATMANPRLLVFSSFRHTIHYLERALQVRGVRVGVVHGDIPDDERRRLRTAFAADSDTPEAIDVLLSSEVGSEGLDFQFCDAVVNYDVPWNPMRIEQRIGRIDRYGQRSPTVAIYNMVTPGTVDFDIYTRCLMRIGIFERSIGGSEAILGEVSNEIHKVAEDFTLTDDERQARLQQLADNELRHIAESEALEERQSELFGVRFGRQHFEDEVAAASSRWLQPEAIERLVNLYLERALGMGRTPILGQGATKTLRLAAEARRRLTGPRRSGRMNLAEREWDAWLRGETPTLGVTFDRQAALDDRRLTFITPVHPLTQAAAGLLNSDDEVHAALSVVAEDLAPGRYPFAIYQWTLNGLKEDALLVPVLADADVRRRFMELLAQAKSIDADLPERSALEALDGWHHELWTGRLAQHKREASDVAAFRRESLAVSHAARMVTLREQLARTQEGRIRRMRGAQIARAETDYHEALATLTRAEGRADILARRVASGLLVVEGA